MDFYYHPILGLQLTFGTGIFKIDLDTLPKDTMSFDESLELFYKHGVEIVDSTREFSQAVTHYPMITSNSTL